MIFDGCVALLAFLLLLDWISGATAALRNGPTRLVENDSGDGNYWIGTGIHDITGPAAEVNMMGYGQASQTTHGIHQRLWARAFVISENPTAKQDEYQTLQSSLSSSSSYFYWFRSLLFFPIQRSWNWLVGGEGEGSIDARVDLSGNSTICFVSYDMGMGTDVLSTRVLKRLDELLAASGTNQVNLCCLESLSISGTHTHSGPAGFLQYALYQIQSLGFLPQVLNTLVEGVAQALFKAHLDLRPGHLYLNEGELWGANINRSPTSYLNNPKEERDEYASEGDTDKRFLQLVLEHAPAKDPNSNETELVGLLNWFAVHPTSMNSSNQLISGDNKGYASYLMERKYNPFNMRRMGDPDKHKFVAAFASTNLGDVSPNTAGPKCLDSGLPCDPVTSTCHGLNHLCVAFGPGRDMFESTEMIGRKQFDKAQELLEAALTHKDETRMSPGRVRSRHAFIDMSQLNVTLVNGDIVQTCPAALGYGFAAGTMDGHGAFYFKQGSNSTNEFWNFIGRFLSQPSSAQIQCQAPKPILLDTGHIHMPYDWDPKVVPISVFQIGQLFILNVPGEFTTMAGRRLRKAVQAILDSQGYYQNASKVTIAGLSNSYTHYITTREEYQGQRYEAASTLYGPYTLEAYIQEFERIVHDLLADRPTRTDAPPKDQVKKQISMLPPVEFDAIGAGRRYGSVVQNVRDSYDCSSGRETVKVLFRSANPRHNLKTMDTFLTVERLGERGSWSVWMTDADWDTKFIWKGGLDYFGTSFAEIHWTIAADTPQGIYRLCHAGTRKTLVGHAGEFLYYAPDLLGGSAAVNLVVAMTRLVLDLSRVVQRWLGQVHIHHYRDFHGCSSSFLVYDSTK